MHEDVKKTIKNYGKKIRKVWPKGFKPLTWWLQVKTLATWATY